MLTSTLIIPIAHFHTALRHQRESSGYGKETRDNTTALQMGRSCLFNAES